MRGLVVLLLLGAVFAGCLDASNSNNTENVGPDPDLTLIQQLVAGLPKGAVSNEWNASAGVDWWENFVQTYPKRDVLLQNNGLAAQAIADDLVAEGLDARVLTYLAGPLTATSYPVGIHVVMALKRGLTDPDHAIAIGAHYDTQTATVQGAFDNGAGTAMVYELCKHLAKAPMQRSLLCLFFDAEEIGARGSAAYNAAPPADAPQIDFFFGYDMVGINWPGYPEWKLHNWVQAKHATDLYPLVEATLRDVLGWPVEGAEAFAFNDRNSDESTFIRAGIPTIRFAGGRTAGAYDEYHMPDDTVAHVYEMVGGRANFELGFGAVAKESYVLALMLDQTNLTAIQAAS